MQFRMGFAGAAVAGSDGFASGGYILDYEYQDAFSGTMKYKDFYLMKVLDIIRLLEDDGWRLHSTRGSHRQYKHPNKPGRVTVAGGRQTM